MGVVMVQRMCAQRLLRLGDYALESGVGEAVWVTVFVTVFVFWAGDA
jgi:hypothetical protein